MQCNAMLVTRKRERGREGRGKRRKAQSKRVIPIARAKTLARAAASEGTRMELPLTMWESSGPSAEPLEVPDPPPGAGAVAVPARYPVEGTVATGKVVGVVLLAVWLADTIALPDIVELPATVELPAVVFVPVVGDAFAEPIVSQTKPMQRC